MATEEGYYGGDLIDIGLPNLLSNGSSSNYGNKLPADPLDIINKKFLDKMKIIDLIPVSWNMNIAGSDTESTYIAYDYKEPINKYKKKCVNYGLDPYSGLRLWLTSETSVSEEFSNDFGENFIQSKLNDISNMSRTVTQSAQSFGSDVAGLAEKTKSDITSGIDTLIKTFLPDNVANPLAKFANVALGIATEGKHVSLPRVWNSSSYNPTMSLNIKLISPYGSMNTIKKYVLDPLIYLLILGSPETKDGLSYGHVGYVKVKAYGITDINLGYIESISISRGGDNIRYNKYRVPTSLELTISIKPAIDGFGVVVGNENDKFLIREPETNIIMTNGDNNGIKLEKSSGGISTVGNIITSFRPYNSGSDFFFNESEGIVSNIKSAIPENIPPLNSIKSQTENILSAAKQKIGF